MIECEKSVFVVVEGGSAGHDKGAQPFRALLLRHALRRKPVTLLSSMHQDYQVHYFKAKGSLVGSEFQVYSASRTIKSTRSGPYKISTNLSAISVPAETPDDVMYFPSKTQRACPCQRTSLSWLHTSSKRALLEVALRPFRMPALARMADPVQTEVVHVVPRSCLRRNVSIAELLTSFLHPIPPGTMMMSN